MSIKGILTVVLIIIALCYAGNDEYKTAKETEARIKMIDQVDGVRK